MSTEVETGSSRPRATAEKLREEFDRLVEAAWSQGERAIGAMGFGGSAEQPPANVVETPTGVEVAIDVAGLTGEQLDVTLAGNMLTVRGEFPVEEFGEESTVHLRERRAGPFKRSFPLPASVDPESIVAECRDGQLRISVSKVATEQARKIPVRSQSETPAPRAPQE